MLWRKLNSSRRTRSGPGLLSEFDGDDIFFGLVIGLEIEFGYFSLSELQSVRGPLGLPIERDLHFEPKSLRELRDQHKKNRGGY